MMCLVAEVVSAALPSSGYTTTSRHGEAALWALTCCPLLVVLSCELERYDSGVRSWMAWAVGESDACRLKQGEQEHLSDMRLTSAPRTLSSYLGS